MHSQRDSRYVGVETFGAASRKDSGNPAQGYCSRITDRSSGRLVERDVPQSPNGVPMATVFVRPLDQSKPVEVKLFEGERARRLGRSFSTQEPAVQQSLSELYIPKPQMGSATFEMAVDTLYGLDSEVLKMGLALHASNLFATMEFDPREIDRLPNRYVCASEFQTPVQRAQDQNLQQPPTLEMRIWNLKSVASHIKQRIVEPVGQAIEVVRLRQNVEKLQKAIVRYSHDGNEAKVDAAQKSIAESTERLQVLEQRGVSSNAISKLIFALADRGISVEVFNDKGQRRSTPKPDPQIIIGDPKGTESQDCAFNTLLFRFEFPKNEKFSGYLNEYVVGSNGQMRMKDTVLHHIEQLRTEELNRVASLFSEMEYPDMPEANRKKLVSEIQSYARMSEQDRASLETSLSEEAAKVFAVVEKYLQVNTITPRTAFRNNDDWVREFSR